MRTAPIFALAALAASAAPALAAPDGCAKPDNRNAVAVVAQPDKPVVGEALTGKAKPKDAGVLPGDAAGTVVAEASDRCPAGYVQQYFQQPATRPIQYFPAAPTATVVTASPDAVVQPPRN
jgi:hypothetical protein